MDLNEHRIGVYNVSDVQGVQCVQKVGDFRLPMLV